MLTILGERERARTHSCRRAVASFRAPDEHGDQPLHAPIRDDAELEAPLHSLLPLDSVVPAVAAASSVPVAVSHDPGRFVCNYVYYRTLSTFPRRPAVFMHVPIFAMLDADAQCRCAVQVLRALRDHAAAASDSS